ncbi:DEAD-box ATP-dependent RNA helicase FANCM isoform X4 [Prunus avium]|nr:DEAD-box ATP-dependent RNA helicase FANCM isoform X4 [Prunus avium]
MTGQISPTKRACLWKTKRVFFVTPQVLEKDIQSGTCSIEYLVCLVIDEAHRALGNYSYSVAVRELMAAQVQLRILALSATPGSKQQAVQQVIDNLYISTLEYRNEDDGDVKKYVHNREVELIQVAMGQEAVEIDNKLVEAMRPFATRLCAIGVLPTRDVQTLSPCYLLDSREKFRQAPPDLPQIKSGDIEGYFGALLTLYHIRKLISSHGIRPAYEMLEEKLKQGSFARYMCRNEDISKAKLIMQQTLSHGAPSPKLSKMLEVLLDHFKTNDPQKSRVIIFSNFRGSVRDIMDALANIGNFVRATEFIGQSSGKALKGQSQKVQQAVLEKFRAGGYNVIVATSIGEEGLDIMEVDLVICFDANVSPLRMIQRMGRTGRKHDGRVVVLACEGSELKGYKRKQGNSKNMMKHMRNGGRNSFNFHSSPRMIPHIFKPEVQFVEFSIEQFVHRGKKVIDDNTIQTPVIADKLTVAETTLIAKYFEPHEITWKPSLIAFPHFQTYPSRVYKVMHSHRTTMLIDMMQCLQGLTFSRDSNISLLEDEICLKKCLGVDTAEQHDNNGEDFLNPDDSEVSPTGTLETEEKHNELNYPVENPYEHSYLFGSDVVTVDASGNVLIMVVPVFPWKDLSHSMSTSASIIKLDYLKQNSCHARTSDEDHTDLTTEAGPCGDLKSTQLTRMKNEISLKSRCCDSETWMEKSVSRVEKIPQTPILKGNLSNQGASVSESPDVLESKASLFLADEDNNFFRDGELSPRLTNLIKSGVVPESPIHNSGLSNNTDEYLEPDPVSPAQLHTGILLKCSSPGKSEKVDMRGNACGRNVSVSPVDNEIQTPLHNKGETASIRGCTSTSPIIDRAQTVLADLTNNSCGKDWHLSSGDKSESVKQARKFRRLRKVGDHWKSRGESMTKNGGSTENPARSFSRAVPLHNKHDRGKKKSVDDVRVFIEEEAEVSSEADISDDEEDERDNYSNDSFIDDRINPTVAGTQFATGGIDMMAIYRRSLLTQSPLQRQPSSSTTYSPDSVAPTMRTTETGSSCGKPFFSLQTPQSDCTNQPNRMDSKSFQMNCNAEGTPCTTGVSPGYEIESRKRKLGSHHSRSVPAVNLEREFSLQSEAAGRDLQHNDANGDVLYDDLFFEGLDLDAVEAQATLLLKQKSELPRQKQQMVPNIHPQNPSLQYSPTFDLGI